MQTPCTSTDITKHAIIGLALSGGVCLALAAIGTAREDAESLTLSFPPVASAPTAQVMRSVGARDGEANP